MSTNLPMVIDEANLSLAWGRAFLWVMNRSPRDLAPLVVSINGFGGKGPAEDLAIRDGLDKLLDQHGKCSCEVTAFSIFPHRMWLRNQHGERSQLYSEYLESVLPRLKARDHRNQHGTYFERMIDFCGAKNGKKGYSPEHKNQLEHIIKTWNRDRGKHRRTRRSALQAACFDPIKDLTGSALSGFPCLQQVSFSYDDQDGLAVNAYYPTQYMFDRAYGNYLGLYRLGEFMAKAMALNLVRLSCFIGQPELGKNIGKRSLQGLVDIVRGSLLHHSQNSESISPIGLEPEDD